MHENRVLNQRWIRGFGYAWEGVKHPTIFVRRRLPPSMCYCVCLINQAKMLDYY